jgi:hypothetical protein
MPVAVLKRSAITWHFTKTALDRAYPSAIHSLAHISRAFI